MTQCNAHRMENQTPANEHLTKTHHPLVQNRAKRVSELLNTFKALFLTNCDSFRHNLIAMMKHSLQEFMTDLSIQSIINSPDLLSQTVIKVMLSDLTSEN